MFGKYEFAELKPKEMDHVDGYLLSRLTNLTALGFMQEVSSTLEQDVLNHVLGCDRVRLLLDGGLVVGYAAVSDKVFNDLEVCHLEGIIVDPSLHRTGHSQELLAHSIGSEQTVLALHTQHKGMEGLAQKVSNADIDLALLVAGLIGTRNLVELSGGPIDQGRYGGYLYGDVSRFEPMAVSRPGFDASRGDAIVFAGYVNREEL